jgi:hypothetical protein
MRHLHEDAGAVTRIDLATTGAAVIQVLQDLDRLFDDAVRFAPFYVNYEANAARLMFELRVVEPLLRRQAVFESSCRLRSGAAAKQKKAPLYGEEYSGADQETPPGEN